MLQKNKIEGIKRNIHYTFTSVEHCEDTFTFKNTSTRFMKVKLSIFKFQYPYMLQYPNNERRTKRKEIRKQLKLKN
uniref:Uncharacterized protein n=1 Tax=Panagrolaimus sp. PS1159 TaxID=55785 RepID=A0AC35GIP5_9BILA